MCCCVKFIVLDVFDSFPNQNSAQEEYIGNTLIRFAKLFPKKYPLSVFGIEHNACITEPRAHARFRNEEMLLCDSCFGFLPTFL